MVQKVKIAMLMSVLALSVSNEGFSSAHKPGSGPLRVDSGEVKRNFFQSFNPRLSPVEIVAEGEQFIHKTRGKDLIMFIGETQIGKSTTINSLLGTKFAFDVSEKGKNVWG